MDKKKMVSILAGIMAAVMVLEMPYWILIETVLLVALLAVNFRTLWQALLAVVGRKRAGND